MTAQTREALVEVMAEALYAVAPVQGHDWDSLPYETRLTYKRDCNEVLLALEAAGVRLVPVEATDAMWDDARGVMPNGQAYYSYSSDEIGELVFDIYDNMLSASPYKA